MARFRAILLTSLTTFAGLMPLIFEKSTQAQFLIPMAVVAGVRHPVATVITLILVPVCYLLLEDLTGLFRRPVRTRNRSARLVADEMGRTQLPPFDDHPLAGAALHPVLGPHHGQCGGPARSSLPPSNVAS